MPYLSFKELLAQHPIIPAADDATFSAALNAPSEVITVFGMSLPKIQQQIHEAHDAGKRLFIDIDLSQGLGKDRTGVEYLADCGADGLITTRGQLIRYAKDFGLLTRQKFFVLDSQSMQTITDIIFHTMPDCIEIVPGVIGKVIERFAGYRIPIIANGLIETKDEVNEVLRCGATAITTSHQTLWYL